MDGTEENVIIIVDDAKGSLNESGDAKENPIANQPTIWCTVIVARPLRSFLHFL